MRELKALKKALKYLFKQGVIEITIIFDDNSKLIFEEGREEVMIVKPPLDVEKQPLNDEKQQNEIPL